MNEETLKRLKKNPYYKMNSKQKKEEEELTKEPMRKFGDVEIHNDTPEIHKVKIIRKKKNESR